MTRVLYLVGFFLLISTRVLGQCVNSPAVTLSSTSGSTCGTTPLTLAGNTFGGSATKVTITENGSGSVNPTSANKSPFTFTYTPKNSDIGRVVTITITTDNPLGMPCAAAKATFTLTVSANTSAPVVGTITKPTCAVATGSVVLSGLPSTGTWTLTRNPGGVTSSGTGSSTTISGISAGTFNFTVKSSAGCTSAASSNVVIPAQLGSPVSPVSTVDCTPGFGKAVVQVTSPTGTGFTFSLDAGAYQSGPSFSNVTDGNHSITVKNSSGCTTTGASFPVSCACLNSPVVTLTGSSGSTCGTTPLTVSGNTFGGSATNVTITENGAGTISPVSSVISPFAFTYTPAAGDGGNTVIITVKTDKPLGQSCSEATAMYTLTVFANLSAPLVGVITQPSCVIPTGSVALNGLPFAGAWTLTCYPEGITTTGTGTSTLISGLAVGSHTFTVSSAGCISVASASIVITAQSGIPAAPVILTVTQPTCSVSTGSAILNGLPSTGTWTLIRTPGGVITPGSGTSISIPDLPAGNYTFTVTNSVGCISPPSAGIVITTQPSIPTAPVVGVITAPTCVLSTGSVLLTGLPASGTWTLTRYPGTVASIGTGTSITLSLIPSGQYNYTLTSAGGCVSALTANVLIPAQPITPSPPSIGTITQPHIGVPTGSVVMNGLPASGAWTLTQSPDNINVSGTGISATISGLAPGSYKFNVTNSSGCISGLSENILITQAEGNPVVLITNPSPVCYPATVDITAPKITAGSTLNLTYTYWTDATGKIPFTTPSVSAAGTWYIKGTKTDGSFTIQPVMVTVYHVPLANAGPDQLLTNLFVTKMDAEMINNYETGAWSVMSGSGEFFDLTYPKTAVNGLSADKNIFLWTVTNGVCPASLDSVMIIVQDHLVPTLITPNMDGKNDYLVIKGFNSLTRIELVIFDRRGVQVYKNENYDNLWNGIDSNENPLPEDTYFYVLKTEIGKSINGYVVIRK